MEKDLPAGKICMKRGKWKVNEHFVLFSWGLSLVCLWVLKLAVVFIYRLGCASMHFIEWKWAGFGMGSSRCRSNLCIYWDRGLDPTQFIPKMKERNFWTLLRLPNHLAGLEIEPGLNPWTKLASALEHNGLLSLYKQPQPDCFVANDPTHNLISAWQWTYPETYYFMEKSKRMWVDLLEFCCCALDLLL